MKFPHMSRESIGDFSIPAVPLSSPPRPRITHRVMDSPQPPLHTEQGKAIGQAWYTHSTALKCALLTLVPRFQGKQSLLKSV